MRFFALFMLVIVIGIIGAVYGYFAMFKTRESINVEGRLIDLVLDISSSSGSKMFKNVASVNIGSGKAIQFVVLDYEVNKDLAIALSGVAILRSSDGMYKVHMPCLLTVGMECYRIQILIPGYDVPLAIEPGNYTVDLSFSWRARGRGSLRLMLAINVMPREGRRKAMIVAIGVKPPSTDGWIWAEGSTRSYALLVESKEIAVDSSGLGSVKVYAWIFAPSNQYGSSVMLRFTLLDAKSGKVVVENALHAPRRGSSYAILALVKAPPGSYILRVRYPRGIVLEVPITFYFPNEKPSDL